MSCCCGVVGYDDFKSPAAQAHWQLLKGVGKRGDLYTWQAMAVKVCVIFVCLRSCMHARAHVCVFERERDR